MAVCINKNSVEYQSLVRRAGIPESIIEAYSREYMEKYNRFPYLDELPNVNSEDSLRQELKIKKNNSTQIEDILRVTGTSTIEEANIDINNKYRDLEVEIVPVTDEAIVKVQHRPTITNFNVTEVEQDSEIDNYQLFNTSLIKLANLYGININSVTEEELNSEEWANILLDIPTAFVYNNEIYVNLDRADVDAPIHELFHILVGSMRFTNPTLYKEIIDSIENIPNYSLLAQNYLGRSRNDVNEEIFVEEVAKYLTNLPNSISDLDSKVIHEIEYNIKRILDTILMGQDSARTISNDRLYTMSLKQLATELNSFVMKNEFHGTMNVKGSELHRRLNNIKAELIQDGTLKEVCD